MIDKRIAIRQLKKIDFLGKKMQLAAESWKNNFQTLISIILSARTRDEITIKVCKNLFYKYPDIDSLSEAKINSIMKIIKPVNFYKNKSKNIINCSKILKEKYNSKIPADFKKLINLPGVGRKTANVFLSTIGISSIGVDTHLSYISQSLKWSRNKKPEKIEDDLKKLFGKKYWNSLNPICVRFGKTYTQKKGKDLLLKEISNSK